MFVMYKNIQENHCLKKTTAFVLPKTKKRV